MQPSRLGPELGGDLPEVHRGHARRSRPPIRVHLALPRAPVEPWHEYVFGLFRKWLEKDAVRRYVPVEDPAEAAFILYFELTQEQSLRGLERLLDEPLRLHHANKLVTFNQHWRPRGFLPGLYTGLPRGLVDRSVHHPWGFPFLANGLAARTNAGDVEPTLLYSFRGAMSNRVRERILATSIPPGVCVRVQRVDRWLDHSDEERVSYVEELCASKFVLCPRGIGPSSHRLFETMAVGRCPVIISDAWAPVPGVDWDACSIRVAEANVTSVPEILLDRESEAAHLGERARRVWQRYFSPANGPRAMLDVCRRIVRERREDWGSPELLRRRLESNGTAAP